MAKNAHLVLDERTTIEVRLRERASFTEIGRELGKGLGSSVGGTFGKRLGGNVGASFARGVFKTLFKI